MPAGDIRDLARIYATEKPATIAFGYSASTATCTATSSPWRGPRSPVLTGNIGRPGASVGVASHGLGYRQATLALWAVPQRRAVPIDPEHRRRPNAS